MAGSRTEGEKRRRKKAALDLGNKGDRGGVRPIRICGPSVLARLATAPSGRPSPFRAWRLPLVRGRYGARLPRPHGCFHTCLNGREAPRQSEESVNVAMV